MGLSHKPPTVRQFAFIQRQSRVSLDVPQQGADSLDSSATEHSPSFLEIAGWHNSAIIFGDLIGKLDVLTEGRARTQQAPIGVRAYLGCCFKGVSRAARFRRRSTGSPATRAAASVANKRADVAATVPSLRTIK
jgi:hypothetical protein